MEKADFKSFLSIHPRDRHHFHVVSRPIIVMPINCSRIRDKYTDTRITLENYASLPLSTLHKIIIDNLYCHCELILLLRLHAVLKLYCRFRFAIVFIRCMHNQHRTDSYCFILFVATAFPL